jgi:Uri superfamily endonuclease
LGKEHDLTLYFEMRPGFPTQVEGVDSGAYQLIIRLDHAANLRVGALGSFDFRPGVYIYTGRAVRNLAARLTRHVCAKKALRWHIDYLLEAASVEAIRIYPGRADEECAINLETVRVHRYSFPIPGFGSSDCRCPAHLVWAGNRKHQARPLHGG